MASTAESILHPGNQDELVCSIEQTAAAINESSPAVELDAPSKGFEGSSGSPLEAPSAQVRAADGRVEQNPQNTSGPSEMVQLARAAGRAAQASLTQEEKQAARQQRRERTRKAKLEQHGTSKVGKRSKGRRRRKNATSDGIRALLAAKDQTPDPFDEWLGRRLRAWCNGVTLVEGSEPPEGYGAAGEIRFDLNADEIAFPTSLSALQRRQVHGWAMQLALFHASSGDDAERHVIISKTGEFEGKHLTRGGRMWYKEGVKNPDVKRFALQEGNDKVAEPLTTALQSFGEEIQKREAAFVKWLVASGPGPLDGSDVAKARKVLTTWPVLKDTKWTQVDTPEKLAALVTTLEACEVFGFDVEAHNARTFHGLTCLLQISTQQEDYVVDPLTNGMWDSMSQLRGVFANPEILKIGHSIRSCDVPSLFRDFGIVIINAVDTEEASHVLGDKQSGLAAVLENGGVKELHDIGELKYTMQTCDWRERPLTSEMLFYARCDSHYLIPLWHMLRARMLAEDTEAKRADSREGREIRAIERRLRNETREMLKEERGRKNLRNGHLEGPGKNIDADSDSQVVALPSSSPRSVSSAGLPHGQKASRNKGSGSVGVHGTESPVAYAQEPWPIQWEYPEDCHRRQRSRSGSILRSDLESIHESDSVGTPAIGGGGGGGGRTLLESDFSTAFEEEGEDTDEGQEEGAVRGHGVGSHGELGFNGNIPFDVETDADVDDSGAGDGFLSDEDGEDEDEDLWEGWGEQDGGAMGASEATAGVDQEPSLNGPGSIYEIPKVVDASSAMIAGPPASNEQPIVTNEEAAEGSADVRRHASAAAAASGGQLSPHDRALQTDGVRLMWKALCRAHLATSVLWKPAPEGQREGAYRERHFRTAVQRLTPPRWTDVNVLVYEEIYLWRERTARRLDDGPAYVCSGDILIDVALALPTTLDDLRRVSVPLSPVLGTGSTPEATELVQVVRNALGLPVEGEERVEGDAAREQIVRQWDDGVVTGDSCWEERGKLRNSTCAWVFAFGVTVASVVVLVAISARRGARS